MAVYDEILEKKPLKDIWIRAEREESMTWDKFCFNFQDLGKNRQG